ncbi:DUF645 family protein [Vibrio cholerae]|nr:DUF645 family protein [Vibrio cholerae]EJL6946551.1 DUF645 family protein [Vibrio cholerae]
MFASQLLALSVCLLDTFA